MYMRHVFQISVKSSKWQVDVVHYMFIEERLEAVGVTGVFASSLQNLPVHKAAAAAEQGLARKTLKTPSQLMLCKVAV